MKLVQLPVSRTIVDLEKLCFVAQRDINTFILVLSGCSQGPVIDGVDLDAIKTAMNVEKLPEPPKVATA